MTQKLDPEPRLQGLPAIVVDWARAVVRAVNALIDAVGNVRTGTSDITTTLDGPAFAAMLTADTVVTTTSASALTLGTKLFDTNNCYNVANGRFTPNVAGYYQINFNALFNFSAGGGQNMHVSLIKNGGELIRGGQHVPSGSTESYWNSTGSTLVQMNGTTDYLYIAQTNSASGGTVTVLGNYTQFSGHLARRA